MVVAQEGNGAPSSDHSSAAQEGRAVAVIAQCRLSSRSAEVVGVKDSLPSDSFVVLFADAVGASISTKIGYLAEAKPDREVN